MSFNNPFKRITQSHEGPRAQLEKELAEVLATLPALGTEQHRTYRMGRKNEDGTYRPRFKTLTSADAQWSKKFPERVGRDADLGDKAPDAVNIAAYEYADLPPSRQEDIIGSTRTALESVYRAKMNGTPLDTKFIEMTADTIHEQWLVRNKESVEREIEIKKEQRGYASDEDAKQDPDLANLFIQLEPYAKLDEVNKGYDRDFVIAAIKAFEERHPTEEKKEA